MKNSLCFWSAALVAVTLVFVPKLGAADQKTGTDTDGDKYTIKLTGPGALQVDPANGVGPIVSITVVGGNATSALSVVVVKGTTGTTDGKVSIGQITATGGTGSIGSIAAAKSDLVGTGISLTGGVRTITLGNLPAGAHIALGADPLVKALTVTAGDVGAINLTSPAPTFNFTALKVTGGAQFHVGAIGMLKTTAGALAADITSSGNIAAVSVTGGDFTGSVATPGTLATFTVAKDKAGLGGAVVSSVISAKTIGSIKTAGGFTGDISAAGKIMALLVNGGDFTGHVAAGDSIASIGVTKSKTGVGGSIVNSFIAAKNLITSVILGGNLSNSYLLAGAQLGADFEPGGTGLNADAYGIGSLKTVRIAGNVSNSIIGAGLTPVDGTFNDGNDGVVGGKLSRIDSITVGGMFDGASLLAAGAYPARVSFGDTVDFHFVSTAIVVPAAPVATPLDLTTALPAASSTAFLYTGAGAVQTGVVAGTIKPERASVLRGRTLTRAGPPLAGVLISVLSHPELGQTHSRSDGQFDLAVNGGGTLVLKLEAPGYASVQRQVTAAPQDFSMIGDVTLVNADPKMTTVPFGGAAPMTTHEATMQNDASGPRHAALMFQPGTSASLKMSDGTMHPANSLNIRATEFTVGPMGPKAMPGVLPPNSAYTYCVDLTADEATMAGATSVEFDQLVYLYLENFLHFDVGIDVPSGFYNKARGLWEAGPSGRIIKIVSITAGAADLDVDGDGNADSGATLDALNITDLERQQLAAKYAVNQSLWRVPIPHFSSWDSNWPFGPPAGSGPPQCPPPTPGGPPCSCDCERGSIIETQTQVLGESVPVAGTPFTLNYRSSRATGFRAGNQLSIPVSLAVLPGPVKRIELEVSVGGRTFITQDIPAQPNQTANFVWDGLDAYGRAVVGQQPVKVRIGYVYDGEYQRTSRFGYNGNGIAITGDMTRQEVTLSTTTPAQIGVLDARRLSVAGWTLDVHHIYDPSGRILYLGDGNRRGIESVTRIIDTVAGTGTQGFGGDGGPARSAKLSVPTGVAIGPDGALYVSDSNNNRIRKVDAKGIITTFAGDGGQPVGTAGDGGPAIHAQFFAKRIHFAPDGSLHLSVGSARVRRIDPLGIITNFAGTGQPGSTGDDGPALSATVAQNAFSVPAMDGTVYLNDGNIHVIRAVKPDGTMIRVAGDGTIAGGFSGDGGPALAARLNSPMDLAFGPDGAIWFADASNNRLRRVGPDGIITTVAGGGAPPNDDGDGGPATLARLSISSGAGVQMANDARGNVYFTEPGNGRIRCVSVNGTITTIAGNGSFGYSGDGGPATAASIFPSGLAVAPDGAVYFADEIKHVVRRISSPLPGFGDPELSIPSEDGGELYRFDQTGRHLSTVNTFTKAVIYSFGYDADGQLIKVTDGDGNVTRIDRSPGGAPLAIVGPYGQKTTLGVDATGSLNSVGDPLGGTYSFISTAQGLLLAETDPVGGFHLFTYDIDGRLIKDEEPGVSFTELARVELAEGFKVTTTSALGVTKSFQMEDPPAGGDLHTNKDAAGLATIETRGTNGVDSTVFADGTVEAITSGPEPRFGQLAPLEAAHVLTTPGGRTLSLATTRTATLTDPTNVLSLTALTENVSINGHVFTSAFDAATRTFTHRSPLLRERKVQIDGQGRVLSAQVGALNAYAYAYDAKGRLLKSSNGTGAEARTLSFTYGASDLPATRTDSAGSIERYAYDANGFLTTLTAADGGITRFTYNAIHDLATVTPPGRAAQMLTFTPDGQFASHSAPEPGGGAAITTFEYDADHRLSLITRPGNATVAFGYDATDHFVSRTLAAGVTAFTYDATGNLATVTTPAGESLALAYDGAFQLGETWTGPVAGSVAHTLDNDLRPASQSVNGGSAVSFSYDNDGLLIAAGALILTRHPQLGVVSATGITAGAGTVSDTRTYDAFGAVAGYSATYNGSALFAQQFSYDKLGRITQITEKVTNGAATTLKYRYDNTRRLLEATKDAVVAAYSYDPNGNRLTAPGGAAVYDAADRLTQAGAETFTYTPNGEILQRTGGAQAATYTYDALGNLLAATLGGSQIDYVVDGFNRRVGRKVNGTLVQAFLYESFRLVAELDGNNALVSRFVYDTAGGAPAYMLRGGKTYRLISDIRGSVRLVVDVESGAIMQQLDYDAFGKVIGDSLPGFQPFGFQGGLYDSATGLTRFGVRDYDGALGRWTARDPSFFAGGATNFYAFVGNDPINFSDPSGLGGLAGDAGSSPLEIANQLANLGIDNYARGLPDDIAKLQSDQKFLQMDLNKLNNQKKELDKKKKKRKCKKETREEFDNRVKREVDAMKLKAIQDKLNTLYDPSDLANQLRDLRDAANRLRNAANPLK
jgi:RHS repeat-associated protein